jgi:fatty acid-binding protein 4
MDEFLGSWKLESCDNFDSYLKELGINIVLRKLASLAIPTVIFSKTEDEGRYRMKSVVVIRLSNQQVTNMSVFQNKYNC